MSQSPLRCENLQQEWLYQLKWWNNSPPTLPMRSSETLMKWDIHVWLEYMNTITTRSKYQFSIHQIHTQPEKYSGMPRNGYQELPSFDKDTQEFLKWAIHKSKDSGKPAEMSKKLIEGFSTHLYQSTYPSNTMLEEVAKALTGFPLFYKSAFQGLFRTISVIFKDFVYLVWQN